MGASRLGALTEMPRPLDPASDFRDDGGTRAWRANQATYSRVIDVSPPGRLNAMRNWYRRTPLWKLMLLTLVLSFGLPMGVLIFGLLGAWALYSLMGWP